MVAALPNVLKSHFRRNARQARFAPKQVPVPEPFGQFPELTDLILQMEFLSILKLRLQWYKNGLQNYRQKLLQYVNSNVFQNLKPKLFSKFFSNSEPAFFHFLLNWLQQKQEFQKNLLFCFSKKSEADRTHQCFRNIFPGRKAACFLSNEPAIYFENLFEGELLQMQNLLKPQNKYRHQ
jgi:hypothetical protein